MKYHLFLIHYIFETRSTTTSCHMCVVFCWSSCPFPEKNTPWANDQNIPRILGEAPTSRSILMKNWCQADPDPMLRWGGGHRTWSNGEEPPRWGSTKAGLRQKWRIQDDNSRFWWVMSCGVHSGESCQGRQWHIVIRCQTFGCLPWHWGRVSFYDMKLTKTSN